MSEATTYEGVPSTFLANPIKVCCTLGIYYLFKKVIDMNTKVRVSPEGVSYQTGVLRRDTVQVPAARLSTYKINQSLYERMFGLCTLEIYGAGDRPELVINALPLQVKRRHSAETQALKAALSQFDK